MGLTAGPCTVMFSDFFVLAYRANDMQFFHDQYKKKVKLSLCLTN
jgi:hypothetical protein